MTEADTSNPIETTQERKIDPAMGQLMRRRLGRLADYAGQLSREVIDIDDQAAVIGRLTYARDELADIITVLGENAPEPKSESEPEAPRALGTKTSRRLEVEKYPDHPFYNGILPGTDFTSYEVWDASHAINIYIIGNNHLYCPETGRVCLVKGDDLFLLNALLKTQHHPSLIAEHRGLGFRESATSDATRVRFRNTVKSLIGILTTIVPNDFGNPIAEEGNGPYIRRMLHPDISVVDKRYDDEFTRLVPSPIIVASPEVPAVVKGEGLNMTQIAAIAGVSRWKVRDTLKRIFGEDYDEEQVGGEKIFDAEFATQLIAAINSEPDELEKNMLPGYERLSTVMDTARQSGARFKTADALSILRQAGCDTQRLNVEKTHTTRGGVWCVKKDVAIAALLAHRGPYGSQPDGNDAVIPQIEPEPETEPTPEPEATPEAVEPEPDPTPEPEAAPEQPEPEAELEPELKGKGNTLSDIAAYLQTTTGETFSEVELENARDDPEIRGMIDTESLVTGSYSFYAANKISRAAIKRRT